MAKIYRKRGNKLNEVVTFDSACTRQENQPLVYDATDGSVHTTTHIGCLDADDVSVNNLTVTGQAIIQEQVTDTIGSNTLVLRSNAEAGLAGSENSGLIIHNYNGSADLYAVTDNTGTFRVGTAVSTTTTYPYLRYNETDNKWYSTTPEVTPAVEVTPVGSPTSWDSVVTSGDDVEYTNIVFSVIDRSSLEPLTTRDESSAMEESYLTKWDATNEKIITTGTSCTHDLCANGNITSTGDITADGNVCVKTNITVDGNSCLKGNSTIDGNSCVKGTSTVSGEIHSCDCLTAPIACISDDLYVAGDINNCNTNSAIHGYNGCFENNFCIKGDLSVDGFATISGLMSDYVATTEDTTTNDWEYLTFVPTNHLTKGRNPVYTDGDLKYNPYSNTARIGKISSDCISSICAYISNIADCTATKSPTFCISCINANTDYAIPLYNNTIASIDTSKQAELSYINASNAPKYNPTTNLFSTGNVSATGLITGTCGFTSDGTSIIKSEAGNELNIYPSSGDSAWINYRGGVSNMYIGNGSSTGARGNVFANCFIGCNNYHYTLPGANGSTAYFEVIPVTDSSAALCFDIYSAHYKIELYKDDNGKWCTKNFFDNRTLTEVSCNCAPYGALKWSPDTNGNKLYFSYTDYRPLTITADQTITVNVCSSNPTTYGYRSSTACRQSLSEYLYDWGNYGCVYRYDGVLYGAQSIGGPEVTIYQDDYPTYYGFQGCLNAWTRGMFISPLNGVGSDNPFMLGDVYSRLPYNQNRNISTINGFNGLNYGCIPSYNTKSAQCSTNYTYNKGFLISGGMCVNNSCQASGYVMGLVGQYDETVSFEGLPRAVYGVRNFCCLTCRTETGVWTEDKFYELIDDRGGQTINGTLSATTFCGNFCGAVTGKATNLDASGVDVYPVGTCSVRFWGCPISDSYGLCDGVWSNHFSMSHGDYDTCFGLSMTLPFYESDRFTWRVRNYGNLCPIHELIDDRGGQRVNGALCVNVLCPGENGVSRIAFTNASMNGFVMHATQTCALYIESYEDPVSPSDTGGVAITNDGVTVFGAGDGCGVLRVVNEDNVPAGSVFTVWKDGQVTAQGHYKAGDSTGITIMNSITGGQAYLGSTSVAIGNAVLWGGEHCQNVVIGYNACACCQDTVAIGRCVSAFADNAVAIGAVTNANCSAVAIGAITNASCYGIALGNNAYANQRSFAAGSFACACAEDTIAIGASAKACSNSSIAIGCSSMACGGSTIALGTCARALGAGSVSIGYNAIACIGFLALGTCARSDVDIDTTIAGNPKFPYSSIIEIDNIKYGRHGRIKFVIPSCSRNIDITSFFNKLFINEINKGRCENTWSTSSWENIPTLVAHLSGFYWDDGGSSDGYQRWAPGVNGRGNINELILLNTSAAASSNLSVYDLIVTCGKNICTTSWNWGTGTNVWTCGMVGTIEF